MSRADLTTEQQLIEVLIGLGIMRQEFDKVLGALYYMHPTNTLKAQVFEEAYHSTRDTIQGLVSNA